MSSIKSYRDLNVWKETHKIVLEIYKLTSKFPKEEQYGIINQIRRSSASIASNIVEGKGRNSTKDYQRFLYIANGSLEETKYLLELSFDLDYIEEEEFISLYEKLEVVGRMISGLIKSLSNYVQEPGEEYI